MRRYAAFLRGINLGGRRLKMDELRGHFEALDVENVSTFIASGNVVFDYARSDTAQLELEAERHLHDALGFSTEVFVRSLEELRDLAERRAFADARDDGFNLHVIFLREPLADDAVEALRALDGDDDRFQVSGREVVWFRRGRLTDAPISTRQIEGALGGAENTMRNLNTVERMVAKFGTPPT
jgi:uncharacterized protein (DUF1697 family)